MGILADNLRRHRLRCRLTQKEVAKRLGCDVKTYSRIEHGERARGHMVARIAEVFGVTPALLLMDSEPVRPTPRPAMRQPLKLSCASCGGVMYTMGRNTNKRFCHQCNGNPVASDA